LDSNHSIRRIVILGRSPEGYSKLLRQACPDAVVTSTSPYGLDVTPLNLDHETLIVFTDGEQIKPETWGAEPYTKTLKTNGFRDRFEAQVFSDGLLSESKMLGIGRGCTALWVFCGGEVYQHVNNHYHTHNVIDLATGELVRVNSTHIDAVRLREDEHIIHQTLLATNVGEVTSRVYYDFASGHMQTERPQPDAPLLSVEAWKRNRMLGVMWHPERVSCPVSGQRLFYSYLNKLVKG
jgi:gamma-glutamyl-gamma-aminobutyrate hydrolase PuuD